MCNINNGLLWYLPLVIAIFKDILISLVSPTLCTTYNLHGLCGFIHDISYQTLKEYHDLMYKII